MKRTAFFITVSLAAAPVFAQHEYEGNARAGRTLFRKMCSGCHGDNAKGGRGTDLTTGNWRYGGTDEDLQRNITKGIPGTAMPGFPMGPTDAADIIAFLHSFQADSPAEAVHGDADAGRRLFFGSAGCSRCHMFAGSGGRLGPDLTRIRTEKKATELRKAINNPDDTLRRNFETVQVTLTDGSVIKGARKNEDTFSVQIFDEREKFHLLLKKDVREVKRLRQSLMPAAKLAEADLENVVTFLKRGDQSSAAPARWEPSADFNVTFNRLRNADREPQNWLTYWGNYRGTHFSNLAQITPQNAKNLKAQWSYQFGGGRNETMPLVVDGLMFVTGPLDDAAALDARTGKRLWSYRRRLPDDVHSWCTVMTNRGFGVLGDRLFLATLDTHLVSLDAKTGNVIWDVAVDDYQHGFSITHAPLAIDGKIIVGVTAGECGNNGFIDAFDAATGKKLWRVWSIAQPGDPNRGTWSGKSAETGGGPTWMTGTYDVETDTLFWTTGNPAPDYDGTVRQGDNLYTCSVLALDPATGKMKWYFQFTPHDTHDWDANETPMLVDTDFKGERRKLLIQANRNGFYYALDRTNGKFLAGKPFVKVTWAKGLDANGHPIVLPNTDPTPEGNYTCPDAAGGANWAAPSYSPQTNLYYVSVREACAIYTSKSKEPVAGQPYTGSGQQEDPAVASPGAIRALDPATGDLKWEFKLHIGNVSAGVLGTAGGVVFAAAADGYLIGLDAKTGRELWHYQTGAEIRNSPIAYSVDGKQYVAIAGDSTLYTFALP